MREISTSKKKRFLSGILIWGTIAAFVWMAVNSLTVVGSTIIMLNCEGYEKAAFTVDNSNYTNNSETGLFWGFKGYIYGEKKRYFDHKIADGDALGYQGVHRKFPIGTVFFILYNPDVTDTLFQARSLNVITYTPDIISSELQTVKRWFYFSVLPFFALFLLTRIFALDKPGLLWSHNEPDRNQTA